MRLLVVEDSDRLRESLVAGLRLAGYAVDAADTGTQGLWLAKSYPYDVIILDLMLPGMDGLCVLRTLRAAGRDSSVIILTAKDRLDDKVLGLRQGADDYLVKPFAFEELLARVEVLVRRRHDRHSPVMQIGQLRIDTAARSTTVGEKRVALSAREFAVLELLALRRGQVLSRGEIESHIYDQNAEPMSNVVDTVIYSLRNKLDPDCRETFIRTRRGMGYVLECEAAE